MDTKEAFRRGRIVAVRGVAAALVVVLAFSAGLAVGGTNSTASVISHLPLVGDGLDATPDLSADFTDFWKAWNALEARYILTDASSTPPSIKDKMFGALEGLVASYNDPYTVYFPPEEAKQFAESISGSFAGVGMEIDIKNNILTVVTPLRGTPADEAGIRAGDQIIAIDGISTDGIAIENAVSKIRGPALTTVSLTLVRDGKSFTLDVVRQKIDLPETEDELDAASGVYSIALYGFSANSVKLFNQAFTRFKQSGATKLVIDLRGNPGGYLNAAVSIASHFLPRGLTVVTEDFGGKDENHVHTSLGYNDLPRGTRVVVLLDGGSASASEIVSGALQDHKVAKIIGAKSFGKGSVQTLIDLGEGSLKITIARWITPNGHSIMHNGITPDIVVPYTEEDAKAKRDPQMERAVQFLTTGK